MYARGGWTLGLVGVVVLSAGAAGQVSPVTDVRVLALRSLQTGRTVRVRGRDIGTLTGSFVEVRDGVLWLQHQSTSRSALVAGIDSMWVSRSRTSTGALVGGLIGSVLGLVVTISGNTCFVDDVDCITGKYLTLTGISLGGLIVGALIGSGAKSWQLRYP
jgi:hypothetical protein